MTNLSNELIHCRTTLDSEESVEKIEATRAVAQLVLLDSNFSALPHVVAEGRRVINNIERVATLFLTKTTYASILAVLHGRADAALPVPTSPPHVDLRADDRHPGLLARAGAERRARPLWLPLHRIARVAIPGGILVSAATMVTYAIAHADHDTTLAQDRTSAVIAAGGVASWCCWRSPGRSTRCASRCSPPWSGPSPWPS